MTIQGNDIISLITGGALESYTGSGGTAPNVPLITAVVGATSITVTIDGDAGVTNYVYYKLSSSSTWISGGNRSGDGNIVISGLTAGNYHIIAFSMSGDLRSLSSEMLTKSIVSATIDLTDKFMVLALNKIAVKGKTVIFRTYPSGVYDPATGETTLGSSLEYTKKIIPPYPYELKYINGDTIKAGDMQTGIAASGIEFIPEPSATKVVIDLKEWSIVSVKPIFSGEQIVLYMLQLRR